MIKSNVSDNRFDVETSDMDNKEQLGRDELTFKKEIR